VSGEVVVEICTNTAFLRRGTGVARSYRSDDVAAGLASEERSLLPHALLDLTATSNAAAEVSRLRPGLKRASLSLQLPVFHWDQAEERPGKRPSGRCLVELDRLGTRGTCVARLPFESLPERSDRRWLHERLVETLSRVAPGAVVPAVAKAPPLIRTTESYQLQIVGAFYLTPPLLQAWTRQAEAIATTFEQRLAPSLRCGASPVGGVTVAPYTGHPGFGCVLRPSPWETSVYFKTTAPLDDVASAELQRSLRKLWGNR
jgi:hypothetical protein